MGTFVVVVEGELMHTEKRPPGAKRASVTASNVAVKPHGSMDDGDAMATRKAGEFFRFQGLGGHGSGKLNKIMTDLSRIVAVVRSTILIITPEGLSRAIENAKKVTDGNVRAALARIHRIRPTLPARVCARLRPLTARRARSPRVRVHGRAPL